MPPEELAIEVAFYSYAKEWTGVETVVESMPAGASLEALMERLRGRYPKLAAMRRSTLLAVGVDYRDESYVLQAGDKVAVFPPVQGG